LLFGRGDGPMGRIQPITADRGPPSEQRRQLLDELEHRLNQLAEYVFLRGPTPQEAASLLGYEPGLAQAVADERAAREQQLMDLLADDPVKSLQLDDIIRARGLYWELGRRLPELLARGNISVESFFWRGKDWLSEFVDDLPSLQVQRALTAQTDRNGNRAWSRNDIHDIDGLAVAVPYCDVVVTERYACDVINRAGLAGQYGTVVIRSLAELERLLEREADLR
jgi:hypothetical protein